MSVIIVKECEEVKKIISIIVSLSCLAAFTSCGKPVEEVPAMATVTSAAETTETTTVTTVTTTETTTVITEPEPEFATVSIAAVGDNLIHSSIYNQAAARSTDGGYDFTYAYENAVSLIRDADMAIINQETLICNDQYEPSTYPRFNSPVALGDHMLKSDLTCLQLPIITPLTKTRTVLWLVLTIGTAVKMLL